MECGGDSPIFFVPILTSAHGLMLGFSFTVVSALLALLTRNWQSFYCTLAEFWESNISV